MKYLDAGVIKEKSSARRQLEDSPSVSFCALDNVTDRGWKTSEFSPNDIFKTMIELKCGHFEKFDDVLACIQNETFHLNETIKSSNNAHLQGYTFIRHTNPFWTEDITVATHGKVFKQILNG